MKKLTDMTIVEFTDVLASDAPAPGGGSSAALAGALGTALTHMVAALTVGKKKYAEYETQMQQLIEEATKVRTGLVEAIDKDTAAFNEVSAVFQMPRETEEEKAARAEAMQKGLKGSTLPPFEIMQLSLQALELTDSALGKSNTNALSDLGVAALMLGTAVQGAWLNVLINIDGIKDDAFVEKYQTEGSAIIEKALPLSKKIYSSVLEDLS